MSEALIISWLHFRKHTLSLYSLARPARRSFPLFIWVPASCFLTFLSLVFNSDFPGRRLRSVFLCELMGRVSGTCLCPPPPPPHRRRGPEEVRWLSFRPGAKVCRISTRFPSSCSEPVNTAFIHVSVAMFSVTSPLKSLVPFILVLLLSKTKTKVFLCLTVNKTSLTDSTWVYWSLQSVYLNLNLYSEGGWRVNHW